MEFLLHALTSALLAVTGAGTNVDQSAVVAHDDQPSVELGLLELSPQGEAGGLAVPASGCGVIHYVQECTGSGRGQVCSLTSNFTHGCAAPAAYLEARNDSVSDSPWVNGSITIDPGDDVSIRWWSGDVTDCAATAGPGFAVSGVSGLDSSINEPSPDSSGTYSIECNGPNGPATASIDIAVLPLPECSDGIDNDGDGDIDYPNDPGCVTPEDDDETDPPTATLEVRNTTDGTSYQTSNLEIDDGDEIQLRWSSTDATSCSGVNFATGGSTGGSTGTVTEPGLGDSTIYQVRCVNGGEEGIDFLKVTTIDPSDTPECSDGIDNDGDGDIDYPNDPGCDEPDDDDETNLPEVTLEVRNTTDGGGYQTTDMTIDSGDEIGFRWSATDAIGCAGTRITTGGATSGTDNDVDEPTSGAVSYTVTCENSDGDTDADTIIVSLGGAVTLPTIDVDPAIVRYGEATTVTWDPGTFGSCLFAAPLESENAFVAGSVDVNLFAETTFVLNCGSIVVEETVRVLPLVNES